MNIFGWIIAVVGLVLVIFGIRMMLKGKKMNAVPFRAPGEIGQRGAEAADAKGLVSTEGAINPQGTLIAPMSGRPCLGYEIIIERHWETTERTEKGLETKKGSVRSSREYKGCTFGIGDSSGQVWVDASQEPDASFTKSHSSKVAVGTFIPGALTFGNMQIPTPSDARLGETTGFEGTERIIEPTGTVYALGQVNMTPHGPVIGTPKGIGTGKLILSNQGRAALVKSTKNKMILGYAFGGVMTLSGSLLGVFGPKADLSTTSAASCASPLAQTTQCEARIYSKEGTHYDWKVDQAATYKISVKPSIAKSHFVPNIELKRADGTGDTETSSTIKDGSAELEAELTPGNYVITVNDLFGDKVKGGFGFNLQITSDAVNADGGADGGTDAASSAPADASVDAAPATSASATNAKRGAPSPSAKPASSAAKAAPAKGAKKPATATAAKK